MTSEFQSIDEYFETLSEDKRAVLEALRRIIRSVVPEAEECLSYQIPAFRFRGKLLVGFGASAKHCALYPMSPTAIEAHREGLRDYGTSKGAIRFQPDKPLPSSLVRKIVETRISEITAQ
jgi:uncharacterized protein YdhG (YjbR/CyaY superfamily)